MLHTILALISFSFVSSITPGPNNLMLMTSGANFGFRRTGPHMLGVAIGFAVMVALVGFGVAQVFIAHPAARRILAALSVIYMFWLAWKITQASAPSKRQVAKPMTFLQAAAFQWVNPKAWAMAVTAVTVYAALGPLAVGLVFGLVTIPCVAVWAALGLGVARWLSDPLRLKIFNYSMAAMLILSLAPVLELAK
ncbi:LysE family translocator [Albirhodobacter sp. R86504]|jgi:threonine/homoserine/homoserine lactone efflux protein|uniref:LysE family translocator n=1 Tax=Albirhodobacter sp. R86504 TaxID=3093848 RepID=UPI00366FF669